VQATDHTVFCDVTGADRNVTLPAASGNAGKVFVVRRVGTGGNECNVVGVQGGTAILDSGSRRGVQVQSDGSGWWVIAETFVQ
jgi:hypothetical protein